MARPRRTAPRQRRGDFLTSKRVLMYLLSGHDYQFLDPDLGTQETRGGELDRTLCRQTWEASRSYLLHLHVHGREKNEFCGTNECAGKPGSRPHGWWLFDAKEPLRVLKRQPSGLEHACKQRPWREQRGRDSNGFSGDVLETEADYLTRLALWLPGERELFNEFQKGDSQ